MVILRLLLNKRVAYVYDDHNSALKSFKQSLEFVLKSSNIISIDYTNLVIKNKSCRYEEHYLCQDRFMQSRIKFFRCMSYSSEMACNVSAKYYRINLENRLLNFVRN